MPAAPPPLANAADDPYRAPSSFDASRPLNGGGGSDVLAAGNASPLPLPPSPFRYDPLSSARLNLPPSVPAVPEVPPIPEAPGRTIWPGGVPPEEPLNIQSPTQQRRETEPPPPLAQAPVVATPAPPQDPQARSRRTGGARSSLGPIGRILTAPLAPFIGGRNGGGFLGFGGFGPPPAFTPYANPIMNTGMGGTIRTSGKTPSGTPWSTGTSNALGGSNALRWTGSGGQTITAYTDPNTGQTFHSFS
jgi:hypothetical protein